MSAGNFELTAKHHPSICRNWAGADTQKILGMTVNFVGKVTTCLAEMINRRATHQMAVACNFASAHRSSRPWQRR
ncbi:hypothetical protein LSAT2_027155 [Lamellibrachia satsuma]|nr:hypothetical protein LSAT2_027155 [Lamellibrachia satsuma]